MQILSKYSEKGDGVENEDAIGHKDNCFWVIDGATDLFKLNLFGVNDDIAYYVEKLNLYISETAEKDKSLSDIIYEAIKRTNMALKISNTIYEAYKMPNFAIMMVRLDQGKCEYFVLGDCTLQIRNKKCIVEITDTRIAEFSKQNRIFLEKLKKKGELNDRNELSIYQKTRQCINNENGYWIGTVDAKGIDKAIQGEIELDRNAVLLGCTDGLMEAFDTFKIATVSDQIFDKIYLDDLVRKLRKCQNQDEGRKHIRTRKRDDVSYILVKG